MLTPVLEKLILSGKAAFKTFMVGGTQKHILNVPNDRFIIITDLVYFSNLNNPQSEATFFHLDFDAFTKLNAKLNTQVKIFSEKSNNAFVFRNSFTAHPHSGAATPDFWVFPTHAPVKLDTYLIHEDDVSFTFSWVGNQDVILNAISRADVPAYSPPFDYGKIGYTGSEPVTQISADLITLETNNYQGQKAAGSLANEQSPLEFIGPVNSSHYIPGIQDAAGYPLLHVSYVEIKGNPTNIEMTS